MTNDATRASAEAMPGINRRNFLLNTTMAGAAVAVAAPVVAAEPEMTPAERISNLVSNLKQVIEDHYPNVRICTHSLTLDDPSSPLPLIIMGQWVTGSYEGDGIYVGGGATSLYRNDRFTVRLLDYPIDGERGFSVIKVGETRQNQWMRLSESSLETFIGPRVKGGTA